MALHNAEIRKFAAFGFIIAIFVMAFIILQPLFLSIVGGLILAYACYPLYKLVFKLFRERNTAALAVCLIIVIILFVPLWFLMPIAIEQTFRLFSAIQTVDIGGVVQQLMPISSTEVKTSIAAGINTFIAGIASNSLKSLSSFLLEVPRYSLYLAVIVFVFFFATRDADRLKKYVTGLSPLKLEKERLLGSQFKEITSSIIYGYVVVGLVQGVATGIGLLLFGIPNTLLLTAAAMFFSIIPMIGPAIVWLPVSVYLITIGNVSGGIGFLLYGLLFVSTIDNFLRPVLVARKTKIPAVLILVGMIGGLMTFNILGVILGPLILAYVLLLLDAYKNKTLADMFNTD